MRLHSTTRNRIFFFMSRVFRKRRLSNRKYLLLTRASRFSQKLLANLFSFYITEQYKMRRASNEFD